MSRKLKCIVCGEYVEEFSNCKGNYDQFCFGYGSIHDGISFDICLCDICFLKKIADGTLRKMVNEFGMPITKIEAKKWLKEHPETCRKDKLKKLLDK